MPEKLFTCAGCGAKAPMVLMMDMWSIDGDKYYCPKCIGKNKRANAKKEDSGDKGSGGGSYFDGGKPFFGGW